MSRSKESFSGSAYKASTSKYTKPGESATSRGEQTVRSTGKLDPLVDPAEYGVIRPSRMRFVDGPDGLFEVANGTPYPIEYRLDTTGSMGDNVARALRVLPGICGLTTKVLPGRDPFYCAGIFGDVRDRFALCRGQFEAVADRMVNQLTLMHPEGAGGDDPEDPHYGFFGAAYLTAAYLQRAGLKSYDFTITDAPCHDRLSENELRRIFGKDVFEKAKENGYPISGSDLPSNEDLVADMLKRTHGFMLLVGDRSRSQWVSLYGKEHVVLLPQIEHVPHVMAVLIGLTEGSLDLQSTLDFLAEGNLDKREAREIVEAVSHIRLGAQCALPNFKRLPVIGDLFASKTDLWPVEADKLPKGDAKKKPAGKSKDAGWKL